MRFWKALFYGIGLLAAASAASGLALRASADQALPPPILPVSVDAGAVVLRLRVGTFDPRDAVPAVPHRLQRHPDTDEPALHLVQFGGPIRDAWVEAISDAGLEIVTYMPDYAYLVWGSPAELQRLPNSTPVRWQGVYEPAYALHPAMLAALSNTQPAVVTTTVQFFEHPRADAARQAILTRARRVLRPAVTLHRLTNLVIAVDVADLAALAHLPEMVSVEPAITPALLDEVQGQIVAGNTIADGSRPSGTGYLAWLTATVGLTTTSGAYPIVDITDDGIDDGDETPQHPDFYTDGDLLKPDRLVYNANWTSDPTADGGGGHGNLNASLVGGYNARTGFPYEDGDGYNYGLGINPFGPIAGSKIFGNLSGWAFPDYVDLVAASYNGGARIISNSWGDTPGAGGYLIDDQIYDALVRDADPSTPGEQPVTIIFAAGNSGDRLTTIGSPANAKNVLTVGASESYRPTWTDGCGITAEAANNANDIAAFSSRGPTQDGRLKPEIVAPGTHVQGAASQTVNYTGFYICDAIRPAGQSLYGASSGTSHATPAVAGAASLLTHFYESRLISAAPSPAMLKAYLINATDYLDGVSSGDTLPSNAQGFGALDLGRAFDTTPRMLRDQVQVFHLTGEQAVIHGTVAEVGEPFRVTLGWTDAPGPTTGAAYVNNLDLAVAVNGETYLGNVFSGAHSIPGGSPDPRNNIESVFLPAGIQGTFTITVTATNLAGDGVPDDVDPTDQDFALVCYNCADIPVPMLDIAPTTLSVCRPATGVYAIIPSAPPGFSTTFTLTVTGLPGDVLSSLAPNPVDVGETSQLAITTTSGTAPGSFDLLVEGVSETSLTTVTATLDIITAPQNPPVLISPTDGITGLTTTPTLTWAPPADATLYTIEIAEDGSFSSLVYTATTVATSHTVARQLDYDTAYSWRVTGANACGESAPSSPRSFTVGPALSLEVIPSRLSICRSATAHYSVTTASAGVGSPVGLSILDLPPASTAFFDPNPIDAGDASRLVVSPTLATPAGAYALRIAGQTATATYSTTAGLDILTPPLGVPSLISPTDAITGVSATPTLTWTPVPGATHYTVQIATGAAPADFEDPATRVYSTTTAATTHTVTQELSAGATYYWQVIGRNDCGAGGPSEVHVFTVEVDMTLWVVPTDLSLCRNATGRYTVTLPLATGIPGDVTLTVQGTPTATTASFSPNPIVAGQESRLTITTTAETLSGSYPLLISGVSATSQPTVTATLDILVPPEAPVRLLSPGDATVDVPVTPALSWDLQPGADTYTVEIATDSAFEALVYTVTVTTTNHTVTQPLDYGRLHYWRVRGANLCGSSTPSVPQSFTTVLFRTYFPIFHAGPAPDG